VLYSSVCVSILFVGSGSSFVQVDLNVMRAKIWVNNI
jgi:hypothetical protein